MKAHHILQVGVYAVVLMLFSLTGCNFTAKPPPVRLKGGDMFSWRVREAAPPIPGITEGRAWNVSTTDGKYVIYVWGDIEQQNRSSSGGSGQYHVETIVAPDGRRIEWRSDLHENGRVTVTINQQSYDPAKGTLFLIASGKTGAVAQLQRDTHLIDFSQDSFRALVHKDNDIRQFFMEAYQRRLEE